MFDTGASTSEGLASHNYFVNIQKLCDYIHINLSNIRPTHTSSEFFVCAYLHTRRWIQACILIRRLYLMATVVFSGQGPSPDQTSVYTNTPLHVYNTRTSFELTCSLSNNSIDSAWKTNQEISNSIPSVGSFYTEQKRTESDSLSLTLLDVNSKLDFLRIYLEATSLWRSLSM